MLNTWLCIMAMTLAINTILVATLLAALDGVERAMFLFATLVLVGAILFTIRTMQRLSRPEQE